MPEKQYLIVTLARKQLDATGLGLTEFLDYEAAPLYSLRAAGWWLPGLWSLRLGHNRLSTLPASLSLLTRLSLLHIQHNVLAALPEALSALISLADLDLSNNRLTVLPAGLGCATGLTRLVATRNPLLAPPPEVLRRGAVAAVRYLAGAREGRRKAPMDWRDLGLMAADTAAVMLADGVGAAVRELYLDDNLLVVLHPELFEGLPNLEVHALVRCPYFAFFIL
jgi:Leucine-rich repeat (LRR) protein